jgi:antitoxin ParD1/3/4
MARPRAGDGAVRAQAICYFPAASACADGERDALIEEGRVARVERGLADAERVIDARDRLLLPGLVDLHVHLREPGQEVARRGALWQSMPWDRIGSSEAMPTRNVVLTAHQSDFIEGLVSSGRYQNASEVLREGLRLVELRQVEQQARLDALREAARIGLADIDAGRSRRFTSTDAMDRHLQLLAEKVIAGKPRRRRGR